MQIRISGLILSGVYPETDRKRFVTNPVMPYLPLTIMTVRMEFAVPHLPA